MEQKKPEDQQNILRQEFEYLLFVWRDKPQDPTNSETFPEVACKAHINRAHAIPRIGESLESNAYLDSYKRLRVFDVKHNLGSNIADLYFDREKATECYTPKGLDGLIRVFAYIEER